MNFGTRTDAAESHRIIDLALEHGLTHFDTANLYGNGESEKLVGAALASRRERVQLATKAGLLRRGKKAEGLSPSRVREALQESLQRLGTDYVDLYYLHAPDPSTPLAQTLDAIQELLEAGRIRAFGVSNFASWQILELNHLCDARRMPRPTTSQVLYNLLIRQLDLEYFAFTRAHPLHTTVYNPLAGGLLARAGQVAADAPPPQGSRFESNPLYRKRYWSRSLMELAERLGEVALAEGMDLITFSYAWLAGRDGVDSILTGPASTAHLEAALASMKREVSPDARARVDTLYREFQGTDTSYAR